MTTTPEYKYCHNCGAAVRDASAEKAADTATQYCCGCGLPLTANSTCNNPQCEYNGEKPGCIG